MRRDERAVRAQREAHARTCVCDTVRMSAKHTKWSIMPFTIADVCLQILHDVCAHILCLFVSVQHLRPPFLCEDIKALHAGPTGCTEHTMDITAVNTQKPSSSKHGAATCHKITTYIRHSNTRLCWIFSTALLTFSGFEHGLYSIFTGH